MNDDDPHPAHDILPARRKRTCAVWENFLRRMGRARGSSSPTAEARLSLGCGRSWDHHVEGSGEVDVCRY